MTDVSRGNAPATYENAVGGNQTFDRSCDMGVKMQQVPTGEVLTEFFNTVGINKENIEGIIKFHNGQIDLTFRERRMLINLDRNMIKMKREGKSLPTHWLYMSENVAVYLSWVPIRMSDDAIVQYFGRSNITIKSIFQQRDEMGFKNGLRSILVEKKHIDESPIKSYFWIGGAKIAVKYRGQVSTCAFCEEAGHFARACPRKVKRYLRPTGVEREKEENATKAANSTQGMGNFANLLTDTGAPRPTTADEIEKNTTPRKAVRIHGANEHERNAQELEQRPNEAKEESTA